MLEAGNTSFVKLKYLNEKNFNFYGYVYGNVWIFFMNRPIFLQMWWKICWGVPELVQAGLI